MKPLPRAWLLTSAMMLDHYQQTKNLMVSDSNKAQGFF
jgi:hypothetical protein